MSTVQFWDAMTAYPQKVTFGEMRASGVCTVLIYRASISYSHRQLGPDASTHRKTAVQAAQNFNRGRVMCCGCLRPPSSDCRRLQMVSTASGRIRAVILWPRSGTYVQPHTLDQRWITTAAAGTTTLTRNYGTRTPRY